MSQRILIVDDEQHLRETVKAYLEQSAFAVATAANGRDAVFLNRDFKPDLIVMDIMMPELDGWEASRQIRRESEVPIIMLTARDDDIDKIAALEMGVDDYMTKPFNPRELVARVRAVLRRARGEASGPALLTHGELQLNPESFEASFAGQPLDLTRSEFDLLATLIAAPGRVFTRMELLDHLHGEAFAAYERTIDVHVKNLRAKIEANPREPRYIETVYGVGYRMARHV